MDERHQLGQHAGVGLRRHAVAQVEDVAGRAGVHRAPPVVDDSARGALHHRPARLLNHRIEVALQRGARPHPSRRVRQRCPPVHADDRRAGDYYRVVDGNRILWGGCITTQTRDPVNLATIMRRRIVETYPQLGDLKVAAAWSGLMSYARHLMPQIGRMPDGLWYATGFGGHGMNTTAIAGRVVAEAIAGESDRIKLFQPFGLDWNGGPFGRIAVQATYWYLQAMDAWRERRNPHA